MKNPPRDNLAPDSQGWRRWVNDGILGLGTQINVLTNNVTNLGKALSGFTRIAGEQLQKSRTQVVSQTVDNTDEWGDYVTNPSAASETMYFTVPTWAKSVLVTSSVYFRMSSNFPGDDSGGAEFHMYINGSIAGMDRTTGQVDTTGRYWFVGVRTISQLISDLPPETLSVRTAPYFLDPTVNRSFRMTASVQWLGE